MPALAVLRSLISCHQRVIYQTGTVGGWPTQPAGSLLAGAQHAR
jgi:hypothetical protein